MSEEQINTIREALVKNGVDVPSWEKRGFKLDLPFKDVYAAVLPMMMRCEPKEVSKFLSSLGYTGIKYPAGTIHGGAEEGDTNYVIFKPEDMKITEHTNLSIEDERLFNIIAPPLFSSLSCRQISSLLNNTTSHINGWSLDKSITTLLLLIVRQPKLDAITSLPDGFGNAVYLGTMKDFTRDGDVNNHYFAYPINYDGQRNYVFCRAMQDANKNRLYVPSISTFSPFFLAVSEELSIFAAERTFARISL